MTKEERKAYNKAYYEKHKEKLLAEQHERYHNDEEYRKTMIQNAILYRAMNPDKVKEYSRKRYEKQKDEVQVYFRKYYAKNKKLISNKRKEKRGEKVVATESHQ